MFRTFNMGWGFAIIVDKKDTEKALSTFEKAGTNPELIGRVTHTQKIEIQHKGKRLILS
jgi:phosphoribosylaminoimidazole (AIR) synthetase